MRALADGTPVIDAYRAETGDVSWVNGHYYAAKAPGLAFVTLPAFVLLEQTGLKERMASVPGASGETDGVVWALGLVGCAWPAIGIALLVRRLGDRLEPGFGVAAAIAAGAGTILLPYASLFYAHVLAAALALGAFAMLWVRPGWGAFAGLLAGFAVVADYPLALAGAIVGVYALSRGLRSGLMYAAGAAAGVVPLAAYQWWAFGSPFHTAYERAVVGGGGQSGHDVLGANSSGFFGVGIPNPHALVELLFAGGGLLRLAPVLALAPLGLVLAYRRTHRAEALTIVAVALAYLVYNAGYYQPFGGAAPGTRFLVPILPFLAIALAPAFRRLPLTSLLLGWASVAVLTAVTITGPLLAYDGRWRERLVDGSFGERSWPVVVPFVVLVGAAVALAWRRLVPLSRARELPIAVSALTAWLLLWVAAPERPEGWSASGTLTVSALAAGAVVIALLAGRLAPAGGTSD